MNSLLRIIFFLFSFSHVHFAVAQLGLISEFTFDNCSIEDNVGNNDGFIFGNPCTCGVLSEGLALDGNQAVEFGAGLNSTISGDFTLSFYVQFDPDSQTSSVDLFSMARECSTDSSFLMRYIPQFDLLRVDFSDGPSNRISLDASIENPECWNYIVFTKSFATGELYINGELESSENASNNIALNIPTRLAIANSPCSTQPPFSDVGFKGKIDEVRVYDKALTQREIRGEDHKPDQILTEDITIFEGESLQIETGQTCSSNFDWSPTDGLQDPTVLSPIASPTASSTTYVLTINNQGCTNTDEITINVVDRERVSCSDLLLPNTFTPNNDGVNDLFGISNNYLIDELISFEVFDKWGGRVFGSLQPNTFWNGNHNNINEPVENGSYVYRVKYMCEGNENLATGVVNVLR